MAKNKAPSKHSRAARRATSPGINTDRSLKEVSLPASESRPSVLATHRSAGVQKKKKAKAGRAMSAKARKRHQKGLEMAEAVVERTSSKLRRSEGRERVVQQRRKGWDEINKLAGGGANGQDGNGGEDSDEMSEEEEDMKKAAAGRQAKVKAVQDSNAVAAESIPVAQDEDGDDVIL